MTAIQNLFLLCLISLSVGCHVQPQQQASTKPSSEFEPVRLSATQVVPLPSAKTGRKYDLWVAYPAGYDAKKKYPVVFVLDAGYAFPLVRSIRNLLGQQGRNIEDFILVGLPPETGLSSKESRSRDYTFSDPLLNPNNDPSDYSAPKYGEAELFREYLETQVLPYALKELNADPQKLIFVGILTAACLALTFCSRNRSSSTRIFWGVLHCGSTNTISCATRKATRCPITTFRPA